MGLDQSQGEPGHFADELFDAAVFLCPCFDLGQQIHGDVGSVGFAFDLPCEAMARVLMTLRTAAIGVATGAADGNQAGGQERPPGLELLLPGLQGAADQCGMFRDFHGIKGRFSGPGIC
jgi:hypothetical protein